MSGWNWVAPSSQNLVQHPPVPQLVQATLVSHLDHCSGLHPALPAAFTHCRLTATRSQGGLGEACPPLSKRPPRPDFILFKQEAAARQALRDLPLWPLGSRPLLLTPCPATLAPGCPRP